MNGSFWAMIYHKYLPWNSPQGVRPASCSYKARGLAKWMGASKHFSTQNGRALCINQLFAAPTFCREIVYFARMFDFYLFLSMSLACMLRPCSPKKASFCKNLLLCHFPAFFSIVLKEQPILFVRKWAQCYLQPVCFTMLTKSEAFIPLLYPFFFCTRVVLKSQADTDKWHGVAFSDLRN